MSEKPPKPQTPEAIPQEPSYEDVLNSLKEKGKDDPETQAAYSAWMTAEEGKRDRNEITEGEITINSIQLFLDAGMEEDAIEICQEIVDHFGPPEDSSGSVNDDGDKLYRFCRSVLAQHS